MAIIPARQVRESGDILPLLDDMLPRGRGFLVMLKVYLDRGQKTDSTDSVMSVASVIFKLAPYKQFVRPWNRMLREWRASAFHATDFYSGAEEFKRDTPAKQALFEKHSRLIPGMVGPHVERILIISFRPEEYLQKASPDWKTAFGTSVHSMAVQLTLVTNGYWRERRCPSQSFAYFMESGDEDEAEVVATVSRMRNQPQTGESIAVSAFTPVVKGLARGTEAADFCAWHWNKYYMDKMRKGMPHDPRKDLAALVETANRNVDYLFATGPALDFFFAQVPAEVIKSFNEKKSQAASARGNA